MCNRSAFFAPLEQKVDYLLAVVVAHRLEQLRQVEDYDLGLCVVEGFQGESTRDLGL